jgi:hypothetical protein
MLALYAVIATFSSAALPVAASRLGRRGRFAEIDVERINVREPDGRLALVISNEARIPGVVAGGRAFPPHRPGAAGLVFYNGDGDECGGLTWGSTRTDTAFRQFGHLSFDGVDQDQTLVLNFSEEWADGERQSRAGGLRFVDRDVPGGSVRTGEEVERARTGTPEERAAARAWIDENLAYGRTWSNRLVVGAIDGTAYLGLNDAAARPRLRATVTAEGVARVELVGEDGEPRQVVTSEA